MQVQKDNIRMEILKAARKEFCEKGFVSANIRAIAKESSVSVGNLYNYFSGKDELFCELVKPTTTLIRKILSSLEEVDFMNDFEVWSLDYHYRMVDEVVDFIKLHRDNLNLLLFKSHKSSLASFKEEVIETRTQMSIDTLAKIRPLNSLRVDISDFFLHALSAFSINLIEEFLMHDLGEEEMKERLREMMFFMFYGWDGVIDISKIFPGKTRMT